MDLDRNEPSVDEKYSGVAEVAVTVVVALVSAVFAGFRTCRMRRRSASGPARRIDQLAP